MTQNNVLSQASSQLEKDKAQLAALRKQIDTDEEDDATLTSIKAKVDDTVQDLQQITADLKPRLDQVSKRLGELGEPPKDGEPAEAPEVAQERSKLNDEKAQLNAVSGQAQDLATQGTDLSNSIMAVRRQLFTARLLEHTDISTNFANQALSSVSSDFVRGEKLISDWAKGVWVSKKVPLFIALMLSLATALLLHFAEYWLFGSVLRRAPRKDDPSYLSRISIAFWSTIMPTLALGAFLVASYFFLKTFGVLTAQIAPIAASCFSFVGLVVFIWLLSSAVLAPNRPHWRLVRLSNRGAKNVRISIMLMVVLIGLDFVVAALTEALSSPLVLTVMKSFLSSVLVGLIMFFTSFMKPVLPADGDPEAKGVAWPRTLAILMRVIGAILVLTAAIGYVGLARFLAGQIIATGGVLTTMYIGFLSGRAISAADRFGETLVGKALQRRFSLSDVALDQTGIAVGLLIYVFVVFIGLPLILLSWGFRREDLQSLIYRIFTEISIGSIHISLVGILTGVLLFALGLLATRWLQNWLDGNVMARSQVDTGVRNSVRTVAGYIGTAIAGLIGISAAGIDLSSLALVAGALSLGIGFGLQNIVQNFVSGLILLAERPFKVGDWVATGATEGFVRRISVRATEIETFQRQSIIVPNSELINASVGNWTHRNRLARIDVPIGVSYDADPNEVIRILGEVGREQEGVLSNPEPFVIFLGFGDSSLDFQLCVFVPDILDSLGVKNGVRVAIFQRFKAEGISIPFPQRDVNFFVQGQRAADADTAAATAAAMQQAPRRSSATPEQRGLFETGALPDEDDGIDGDMNGDSEKS
ncbi:mechanosensitive ion channel domain-containing protein [Rhizobium halophytocola]|uniref:Small-conductance mechanosensitive channel n=1 Tax=Rhizobium halophytocola TaxID=735519 RepID=A0ABS4DZ13_9HYPH|nr:mechanosensitive ion channel domain-containing protein [Rhizobium halophytocola]MBP1850930.1 small-conductance mechanosensitive channel [Rhizobium halophytocola]